MSAPPHRYVASTFEAYRPQTPSQRSALNAACAYAEAVVAWSRQRWFRRVARPSRGLYLVGPVGTGKTHLMAALYHALVSQGVACTWWSAQDFFRTTDTPDAFAERIAHEAKVLCLDEVEVDDPANEVRLVRMLNALGDRGVLLVATSNVQPDKFVGRAFGGDRFRAFLDAFAQTYTVIVVGGDDYRAQQTRARSGRAWIGPLADATSAMRAAFDRDDREAEWLTFDAFLRLATDHPHDALVQRFSALDALYLEDVEPSSTDDALRLLRLLDALYVLPHPPALYVSSETPPGAWFRMEDQTGTLAEGIAEKFKRTVSRLGAMMELTFVR
ncbi:MAG: cell division protein ZapE [Bacteroidetes bacterium]|nr:cell division protein ZapE [Bacteroidota bacterium]